jgi:hypothetical protein
MCTNFSSLAEIFFKYYLLTYLLTYLFTYYIIIAVDQSVLDFVESELLCRSALTRDQEFHFKVILASTPLPRAPQDCREHACVCNKLQQAPVYL